MSKGNTKTYGNKGNNFPYQQSVLMLLGAIEELTQQSATGLAQESTLISVLNAISTSQDVEILLVRDEAPGNGDPVVKQVTSYSTGVPVVTYENVDGTTYVPTPNPPQYVYLDPSAVLNLVLAELITLNAGGQLATDATLLTIDAVLDNILADTTDIKNLLAVTARTITTLRETTVTAGNIPLGARSASFYNAHATANALINGTTLKPGEQISFDAGGQGDTLPQINWSTLVAADLLITSVV